MNRNQSLRRHFARVVPITALRVTMRTRARLAPRKTDTGATAVAARTMMASCVLSPSGQWLLALGEPWKVASSKSPVVWPLGIYMAENDNLKLVEAVENALNERDRGTVANVHAEDLTAMVTFRQNLELSLLGGSRERVDLPSEN